MVASDTAQKKTPVMQNRYVHVLAALVLLNEITTFGALLEVLHHVFDAAHAQHRALLKIPLVSS